MRLLGGEFALCLAIFLTLPTFAKEPLVVKILPKAPIHSGGADGWNRLPVGYNSACTKNGAITDDEITKHRISCDLGKAADCALVAKYFHQKKDFASAETFSKKSCDKENAYGCVVLGMVYLEKENLDAAEAVLGPWCERGNQQACVNLGIGYLKANRAGDATILFRSGCQNDNGVACSNLGIMSKQKLDSESALTLFRRSCDLGACSGCMHLRSELLDRAKQNFEYKRQARESL